MLMMGNVLKLLYIFGEKYKLSEISKLAIFSLLFLIFPEVKKICNKSITFVEHSFNLSGFLNVK